MKSCARAIFAITACLLPSYLMSMLPIDTLMRHAPKHYEKRIKPSWDPARVGVCLDYVHARHMLGLEYHVLIRLKEEIADALNQDEIRDFSVKLDYQMVPALQPDHAVCVQFARFATIIGSYMSRKMKWPSEEDDPYRDVIDYIRDRGCYFGVKIYG